MDSATQIQILNQIICFSDGADTIKKFMNPTIPLLGK